MPRTRALRHDGDSERKISAPDALKGKKTKIPRRHRTEKTLPTDAPGRSLHGRQRRKAIPANLLFADDMSDGREVVAEGVARTMGESGLVIYHTQDRGVVHDGRRAIEVASPTAEAVLLSLALAIEKFGDTLTITGSDKFRSMVAGAAATPGLWVTFSDPKLDAEHKKAVQEREDRRRHTPLTRTWLGVPDKDRDEAERLGAKWDRDQKQYFVPAGVDPVRLGFAPWMPGNGRYATKRTFLQVHASERREARVAGAFHDAVTQAWFVPPGHDLTFVRHWRPEPESNAEITVKSAAEAYAEGRNRISALIKGVRPFRVWVSSDRSDGIYQGLLVLPDGTPAALLSCEDQISIMALTSTQADVLRTADVGRTLPPEVFKVGRN